MWEERDTIETRCQTEASPWPGPSEPQTRNEKLQLKLPCPVQGVCHEHIRVLAEAYQVKLPQETVLVVSERGREDDRLFYRYGCYAPQEKDLVDLETDLEEKPDHGPARLSLSTYEMASREGAHPRARHQHIRADGPCRVPPR